MVTLQDLASLVDSLHSQVRAAVAGHDPNSGASIFDAIDKIFADAGGTVPAPAAASPAPTSARRADSETDPNWDPAQWALAQGKAYNHTYPNKQPTSFECTLNPPEGGGNINGYQMTDGSGGIPNRTTPTITRKSDGALLASGYYHKLKVTEPVDVIVEVSPNVVPSDCSINLQKVFVK